ncbi:MAG TPA: PucR family transcriptional regulator ligand-binding domain-containing protein [Solirubrobacterales bacterium]|nr:PucR family transcriptional regulator ligand-binding domain-containing protein [Solirubrobacterales bacterium]
MLTVQSLLDELDLELAAGADAAAAPVRWVHISELEDPTPWLSGGELMLTTGIPLDGAAKQRAFIRLLADRNLAGLGFGTGFNHKSLPKALVDEAEKRDFPLFEVPYSTPFIAITEKAFARLVNEQYEVLQRGIAVQRRLERLVLEERGLEEIAATVASAVGGTVAVLDGRGERLAGKGFRRQLSAEAITAIRKEALGHVGDGHPFVPSHPTVAGRALAHPVISPGGGPPQAWVVIVRDSGGLGDFERLILQQAVAVVALELMRRRVAQETERRLAGDVVAAALGGRMDATELRRRLEPFGIGEEAAVLVFSLDDPAGGAATLEAALAAKACPGVVAPHSTGGRELLCAVVDCADRDPIDVATEARRELARDRGGVRAGASRPAPPERLRHSFHEARCALEATAFDNGSAPEVASWRDLGAFTLLLSIQDDDALDLYCDSVLGPIERGDEEYGGELLRSLEAFIEQNGQWERAARQVYCHRHTLRYRMRKVEELTGRDLSRAHDRIEFWLALRARELVA